MKYEYISDDASLHDKINFHISKLFFKLRESISFIIPTGKRDNNNIYYFKLIYLLII